MPYRITWPNLKYLLADIPLIVIAIYLASFLRLGPEEIHDHMTVINVFVPIYVIFRLLCFVLTNVYSTIWRYISTSDAFRLGQAIALSSLMVMAVSYFVPFLGKLPRSIIVIEMLLSLAFLFSSRLLRRIQFERNIGHKGQGKPTLIYGAGNNGRSLAQRFQSDSNLDLEIIGFIDDDRKKQKMKIAGIPVLGGRTELKSIMSEHGIRQLIIALPNLDGEVIREIFEVCKPFHIKPRVTPNLLDMDTQSDTVEIFREISLNDLLNRKPRDFDVSSIKSLISGRKVLVTGAGGSIGSEVARQVMSFNPSKIILLDHSEFNLYQIDRELRQDFHDSKMVIPVLLDLKDKDSLEYVCKEHMPDVVFHAAAYKHVHLVEANPFSAILNNVLSTKNLLDTCEKMGVSNFVLISSDKAVNPAGVMGATKRVCELLTTLASHRSQKTYVSVRFGNVLGSSGSLIPLLKKQINKGGPVTITHKDMTRFFMLIPEAVKLVLRASTIANSGDICLLKMGEPVKILDIAKNLILLMAPNNMNIPITFTGLRPGEKMFEELYITGDELETEDPDVLIVPNGDLIDDNLGDSQEISRKIDQMISLAQKNQNEAIYLLNELVRSNYVPPEHSDKFLLFKNKGNA